MSPHHSCITRAIAITTSVLLALGGVLLTASPVAAANPDIMVTDPSGDITVANSLPWAIDKANNDAGPDTIRFDMSAVTTPITLLADLDPIVDDLTIIGPGSALLTVTAITTGLDVAGTSSGSIQVSVSGLDFTSIAGDYGITSDDADLTLDDISANGFAVAGIGVGDGSLSATDVTTSDGGGVGLDFFGSSATENVLLRDVVANGNLIGVHLDTVAGTVDVAGVDVADNITYGINAVVDGGTATVSDVQARHNGPVGFGVGGIGMAVTSGAKASLSASRSSDGLDDGLDLAVSDAGSRLDVSDVVAENNDAFGFALDVSNDATLALQRITARGNDDDGINATASVGGTLTIDDSLSENNGPGCGCGGSGLALDADEASVTVTGTRFLGNTAPSGGGIYVIQASGGSIVAFNAVTISGNHAIDSGNGGGGGISIGDSVFGAGIYQAGTAITVADSTITGNDAEVEGGGVAIYDVGAGSDTGGITFLRTTIDGNKVDSGSCGCSTFGGGLFLGGAGDSTSGGPVLSIQQSTISNNSAVEGEGGGLYLTQGPGYPTALIDVVDSTVSGNYSDGDGGAAYLDTANADPGTFQVAFRHSTIAANTAAFGVVGGVYVDDVNVQLDLESTIISGNDNDDLSFDPAIEAFTALYNLVQNPAGAGIPLLPADHNILGVDPRLATLANNGGPTKTMLIAPGSPAYNAGDAAFAPPPATDQRGQGRVYQVIDIGAVEWHPALALTGGAPRPEVPLWGVLFLSIGLALVAASRMRQPA